MFHTVQKQGLTLLVIVFLLMSVLVVPTFIHAQDSTATPQGAAIQISGPIGQMGNGTFTVSGLTVDISGLTLNATLTAGTVVSVSGILTANNIIVAQTVVINIVNPTQTPPAFVTATATPAVTATATPAVTATATTAVTPSATVTGTLSPTPAVTPTGTPSSNIIIVIEGPVINIVNNIITIYDFDIEVDKRHPILNLIQIGDLVRIEGAYGVGSVVIATVISNLSDMTLVSGASVSLEGPVESINGSIIVVNSISVQLAANDPLLTTVQVGQFVSVQGNFQNNNGTFILVVVNIIVNVNTTVNNPNGESDCYWKESGMSGMGKWKCKDKKDKKKDD